MTRAAELDRVARYVRGLAGASCAPGMSDGELVGHFCAIGDEAVVATGVQGRLLLAVALALAAGAWLAATPGHPGAERLARAAAAAGPAAAP